MSTIAPKTHFQYKVDVWTRILTGAYEMDNDTLELGFRFALSFGMLFLVFHGMVTGWVGVTGATITSGIDLAALFEAIRQSQTGNTDASYQE